MAGIIDQFRRFVVDGAPVATGFAAVGDAWACTNPSAGRGLSVGLMHAELLRSTVQSRLAGPATFAAGWDEVTQQVVAPYYRNQVRADRHRLAEMLALRDGSAPPAPDPMMARLLAAAGTDGDVFRAFAETRMCLATPQEVSPGRTSPRSSTRSSWRHRRPLP
jgi:flavin-dependent dehydrogenase